MQPASDDKRYAIFGPYQADLRTGELRKHGIRLRLQEQPFQVLAMLLSNPGDLVTREHLQKRLWAGDTFVDFDHGLNTAINKLREVLSDSSASPKYIETLPRRGYRFVAAVEFGNGAAKSGCHGEHRSRGTDRSISKRRSLRASASSRSRSASGFAGNVPGLLSHHSAPA